MTLLLKHHLYNQVKLRESVSAYLTVQRREVFMANLVYRRLFKIALAVLLAGCASERVPQQS
jgi:hypothetical protein